MGDGTQGTGSAAGSSVKMERILDDLLKKILYLSHWSVVTKKIPVRGILMYISKLLNYDKNLLSDDFGCPVLFRR